MAVTTSKVYEAGVERICCGSKTARCRLYMFEGFLHKGFADNHFSAMPLSGAAFLPGRQLTPPVEPAV